MDTIIDGMMTPNADGGFTLKIDSPPKQSDWACCIFGEPGKPYSTIYRPREGQEPNAFHRYMQNLFFGVTWYREKTKT